MGMVKVDGFLHGMDGNMNEMMEPLGMGNEDVEEFYREFMANDPNGLTSQVPPELLRGYIKSFIDSSRSQVKNKSIQIESIWIEKNWSL